MFIASEESSETLEEIRMKKVEKLLIKDTTSSPYSKSYWLASSGVYFIPGLGTVFGPGSVYCGFPASSFTYVLDSNGGGIALGLGVRPVVYLQSNVTSKELTISPNGTEEDWSRWSIGQSPMSLNFGCIGAE